MDATWTVPKNIRQIGETNAHYGIYIEDYVSTYIGQFAREMAGACGQGLLVGQILPEEEKTLYVIRGVLTDQEIYPSRAMLFSQEGLDSLQKQKEEYFSDMDVIGEVIFDCEKKLIDTACLGQFAQSSGMRHLFLHVDYTDKSLAFCIGSQGAIEIVESYYIFYDKNEAMQNYLIRYNEEVHRRVEEIHDVISSQAREAMEAPHKIRFRLERENVMTCAVCTLLVCVALLGIVHINQYQKMNKLESSLSQAIAFFSPDTQSDIPASAQAVSDTGTETDAFSDLPVYTGEADSGNESGEMRQEGTDYNAAVSQSAADDGKNSDGQDGAADAKTDAGRTDADPGGIAGNDQPGVSAETDSGSDTDVANTDGATQKGDTDSETTATEPYREYIVQKGDTLTSISLLFYQDMEMIEQICLLNGIKDADHISVGQKIMLP